MPKISYSERKNKGHIKIDLLFYIDILILLHLFYISKSQKAFFWYLLNCVLELAQLCLR